MSGQIVERDDAAAAQRSRDALPAPPIAVSTLAPSAPQRRDYPNRPPADPASVERGKALYGVNCQFCHGADTRGGDSGPSLLRSGIVLDDQHGELIAPVVRAGRPGMPKFTLTDDQIARRRGVRAHLQRRRLRRIARQAAQHRGRRREGRRGVLQQRSARRAIRRPAICAASRRRSPILACCSRRG